KAAARAGIRLDSENVSAAGLGSGIGTRAMENSLARFDELDIGGEKIKNARLFVSDIELGGEADMLLGDDFFLSHRIYIAAKQHKILFTYNGGRVFDLGVPAEKKDAVASVQTEPAVSTAEKTAAPGSPTTAEGLRRRGIASAGRQDFQSAIADFDEAIKLDPADAENYFQRAMAERAERKGIPALRDFDEALKIKPNYVEALTERGALRLAMNNADGARADFDTLATLAPNDATLGLRVAMTYVASRNYDEGIARLDKWIAANSKDDRLAQALDRRCWSRAVLGKDLDLALADCNKSIRAQKNSTFLDSRGVLFLRRGDLDKSIDDFKASLKLQPKSALTLYGLGVAEMKKGAKAEGEKNMQAAVAITPTIAESFKRMNLAP
ncbi:MAG TPA: tetratricopeptide repeat protein, partial [Steroidobacteraceae bacterium]|nr:tetratricopeptide repeat protein [Steroidobacteraceae bacterium]